MIAKTSAISNSLQGLIDLFISDLDGHIGIQITGLSQPGVKASYQADVLFPSASVIKIAIACAAIDADQASLIDLSDTILVQTLDETIYPSALKAFRPEDQLSLYNLMGLMLLVSDNSATTALLKILGLTTVNDWLDQHNLSGARIKIGFQDQYLGEPLRANQMSAAQAVQLLKLVYQNPDYAPVKEILENNIRGQRLPKRLPDEVRVAHKTGSLNGVVNDAGIVETSDVKYAIAIFSDEISDTPKFEAQLANFSEQAFKLFCTS